MAESTIARNPGFCPARPGGYLPHSFRETENAGEWGCRHCQLTVQLTARAASGLGGMPLVV